LCAFACRTWDACRVAFGGLQQGMVIS